MSDVVIRVEGLSKRFRIGAKRKQNVSLQEALVDFVKTPLRNLRTFSRSHSNLTAEETFYALKDISFEIKHGEAVGLIGHNGAGKSTLLKILSRITPPTTGYAEIRGRVGSLLEVGTGFHPELTGRENIYLSGAIMGMRRHEIARKFDEIVAFAEVDQFIDTPVKRYSSGMYVRLAFAVAAHLEPEILLVDEVLAVGDAAFQKKCLGKMGSIAGEGRTVILVSHNMGSITSLTQEAMWLEDGRLREQSSTETVVRNYIKRVNEQIADRSTGDLMQIKNRIGTREFGMLTAARLLTHDGKPATSFLEREPFDVELEFLLKRPTKQIELGCNIRTPEGGTSLFMTPSGQFEQTFGPGTYVSRVRIDPNYLRAGSYSISLYLFVQHLKDDVVPMALGLNIEPYLEADDGAFFMKYSTGYFRFDYGWTEIQPVEKSPEPIVR